MSSIKEIKSIDLSSYTIMITGIAVLFSILSSILLTIGIGIVSAQNIGISIYLIITLIVGTFMYTIYNSFCQGLLYNLLGRKFNRIKFTLKDEKEIIKISSTETATMVAIISTIQVILIYLASIFILPLMLTSTIQTLMLVGQETTAFSLYQILNLLNQPMTIILFIFGTFVITFVFVLLGTYIYNILGSKDRGIIVNLSKENNMTSLDSIDILKLAIAFAIVSGILNMILAIIMLISGMTITTAISNIIVGFVGGFIEAALLGAFYNFLAPKIGKIKLELIDL